MNLKGIHVKIRDVKKEDLNLIVKWRNAPENWKYFFNLRPLSMKKQKAWWASLKTSNNKKFFIIEKENKAIGTIGLDNIDLDNRCAEFGNFLIKKEEREKGYAEEAIKIFLNYAFIVLKLNRLYLKIFKYNKRALSLYKKAGFVIEGILREDRFKDGSFQDVVIMGLIARFLKNE